MWQSLLDQYADEHRHPLNQATHAVGIPLILAGLVTLFFNWKIGLGLFVVGWIFQFVGHRIEGNKPAFFRNLIFLVVGPCWMLLKLKRLILNETGKSAP